MSARRSWPFGRRLGSAIAAGAVIAVVVGCAPAGENPAAPSVTPTHAASDILPEPGRTIAATPAAAGAVETLEGYRVAVVVGGQSPESTLLLESAREFVAERGGELEEYNAAESESATAALLDALEAGPDLVVGMGGDIVDAFSFETPQWLAQQFLVVGAQLAEPTANVTAVIWEGATSRGSAASADGQADAATVTAVRVGQALAVGVASVRTGQTGVVLSLEGATG